MPCRYDGPDITYTDVIAECNKLREQLDLVTRLLCTACDTLISKDGLRNNPELEAWWDAHKIADAQRKLKEEEVRLRELQSLERETQALQEKQQKIRDRILALNGDTQ